MPSPSPNPNSSEAIILVKAFPQVGAKHGETVCVAGITRSGQWLRLFPVPFRKLDDSQQFGRWDIVRFDWKPPAHDKRSESRHVILSSLEKTGQIPKKDRKSLLHKLEVTGLSDHRSKGLSLALLRPTIKDFIIKKKTPREILEETELFRSAVNQTDMFDQKTLRPIEPCPYKFMYRYYVTENGTRYKRKGTCQDWEIQAAFRNWRKHYGEERALSDIRQRFGEEYPQKGMLFAMGTHSQYPDKWLINGIIRMDEFDQMSFQF